MKKLLLSLLVTAFAGGAVLAQDQVKQHDKSEWDKKIKEELKLTPDQVAKYDALNKEYAPRIDAIAKDASLTADVQKEKKMALKKEKEAKFMEILTTDQQAKYKEIIMKKKKETTKS